MLLRYIHVSFRFGYTSVAINSRCGAPTRTWGDSLGHTPAAPIFPTAEHSNLKFLRGGCGGSLTPCVFRQSSNVTTTLSHSPTHTKLFLRISQSLYKKLLHPPSTSGSHHPKAVQFHSKRSQKRTRTRYPSTRVWPSKTPSEAHPQLLRS